ncbi:hypothetical protein GCM10027418_27450 [Mariniluteicoccus endophyticus]
MTSSPTFRDPSLVDGTASETRQPHSLPQDQKRLEELFAMLEDHGRVLVIVDQPNRVERASRPGTITAALDRDFNHIHSFE